MKIFRPNFKNIQENIHGFSKLQRNDIPGNLEQKSTISRTKTAYSGFYGTPDQTLTGGLPLRRRSLYTTELQGHMQKYSIVQLRWTRDRRMLGGGPSILVRYGGLYRKYSILQGSGIRTVRLLGGVCYIHLTKEACRCIVAQVFHTVKRALPRQEPGKGLDFYRSSRK